MRATHTLTTKAHPHLHQLLVEGHLVILDPGVGDVVGHAGEAHLGSTFNTKQSHQGNTSRLSNIQGESPMTASRCVTLKSPIQSQALEGKGCWGQYATTASLSALQSPSGYSRTRGLSCCFLSWAQRDTPLEHMYLRAFLKGALL